SPPALAASRNISACRIQALSQVGCRLMVASSAKISRPRLPPAAAGPSPRTRLMNSAISGREAAGAGGCWERSLLMGTVYTDLSSIGDGARRHQPHGRLNAALLGLSRSCDSQPTESLELWQTARPSFARFQRCAAPWH